MQNNSFGKQRLGAWVLVVCTGTLVLSWLAQAQSAEEVHVSVRNTPTNHTSSTRGSGEIHPQLGPLDRPFRVDVDLVLVPVTVTDASNRTVTTLTKQDFAVFEGNKPQEIRYFMMEDTPVSIAVLLDVSKSMSDKIDTERAAIVEFFNNANPEDEYFAITFSDRPRLIADSTQSIDEIQRKLLSVEPGGPTAMLDAISLADATLRSARYKRKAIVIISDGGDNVSHYTLKEVKSLVREGDAEVYAIGLFDAFFFNTMEEKLGKMWLSQITDATGGRTITVDNRTKLPEAAATISREIRSQYVLGYHGVGVKDGKWRKITVRVTASASQHPLQTYYKKGYIAPER